METQIKKWGNSAAVRIPAAVLAEAGIELDQRVERARRWRADRDRAPSTQDLRDRELVRESARITCTTPIDTGAPVGSRDLAMPRSGVPKAGDIWAGVAAAGGARAGGSTVRRSVLSPGSYNGRTSMMVCCPLTTQIKGYPFEVVITRDPPSAVLADQIRSLDWRARRAVRKGGATDAVMDSVRGKIRALIGA